MATIVDSYVEANNDGSSAMSATDRQGYGQAFTGNGGVLQKAVFYLSKTLSPTGYAIARIYDETHATAFGTDSVPSGAALASSGLVDVAGLGGSLALTTFIFSGANKITLGNGTKYCVTVEYSGGGSGNYVNFGWDGSTPSHAGNMIWYQSSTWSAQNAYDSIFYVYSDASSASISASPSVSPSISSSTSPSGSVSQSISSSTSPSGSISQSISSSTSPSGSTSQSLSPSRSPSVSSSISLSISPSFSPSVSPSVSPEYGLDKLSTTATYNSVWKSNIYSVGKTFAITEIRIPLGATLASGITITPKVYFDDGSKVKTMATINSTNFTGRHVIYKKPQINDYIGENNFYIELNFSGTVYCPVLLPITINLDIYQDEK